MIFLPLKLAGAFLIEPELHFDERGSLARTFCAKEFHELGLSVDFVQCSTVSSKLKGTLRGLHYQREPHSETKLIRCTAGAAFDVMVDLREGSATRYQWYAVVLTAENYRMVYIPAGFAHGCMALTDNVELFYQMDTFYAKESVAGVRWDDPKLAIDWPDKPTIVSKRDLNFPLL